MTVDHSQARRPAVSTSSLVLALDAVSVTAAALLLRLMWLTAVHPTPLSDFAWYRDHALAIAAGQGYTYDGKPTAYFPIGYPLFLAAIYKLFGSGYWSGTLANVILNSLTAGLVTVVGSTLWKRSAGLVAGLIFAGYLSQIAWSSVLCSEMLFTFLLTSAVCLGSARHAQDVRLARAFALGLVVGLACAVRPVLMLAPAPWLAYLALARMGWRKALRLSAAMLAGLALAIAPITVRNALDLHAFVLVSTNGGVNLWQGNNPRANGGYFWPLNPHQNPFLSYVAHEVADDHAAARAAWAYIFAHPFHTLKMGFVKWWHLFNGVSNALDWSIGTSATPVPTDLARAVYLADLGTYLLMLAACAVGIGLAILRARRTRDARVYWPLLVLAYYVALFFIFPAWDRMRAPIEPLLALFAGYGAVQATAALRRARSRRQHGHGPQGGRRAANGATGR
ncbi:ArnT family glycosyltransferase [Alicyclobacillus vulcanalis]|uniref:4-amino-4-deoxy-L-arabinose transferase n=1 Tax=Alicyclobacillus vulcanalis TaxID=252246 RepID=A0A1N7JL26_9BACL|nr:glycosyltransferase family 39 protein [Alicyclobacillus vulcanalis]SIS50072.1 4-amino-4-deoxy-L-arabinose transferase [Alicyclobacillus vulcanalis]